MICEVKIIFFGGKWSHADPFFVHFEKNTAVTKSEGLFCPKNDLYAFIITVISTLVAKNYVFKAQTPKT